MRGALTLSFATFILGLAGGARAQDTPEDIVRYQAEKKDEADRDQQIREEQFQAEQQRKREEAQRAAQRAEEQKLEKARREYRFQDNEECPFCTLDPNNPDAHKGLHWHKHWDRVGLREYIITPLLFGAALAIRFVVNSKEASWTGPILFDQAARDGLVFESASNRATAGTISDALMYASVAYPVLVDNIAVTWLGRQEYDVAWQMFVINAQSYALTVSVNAVVKRATNRERPWGERCGNKTLYGPITRSSDPSASSLPCDSAGRFRSFYSGHAAFTATGAALVCTHHTQLELYKSPAADTATCLSAVAVSTATGVLRMTSDNHWASDVITGHLMGFLAGYVVPTLLYYHTFRITPEKVHKEDLPKETPKPTLAMLPLITPNGVLLDAVGTF